MDPFDHDPFNELPPPKPRSCRFRPKPRKPEEASSSSIASEIPEAGSSGTTALSEILLVEKSGPREDTITLSEDPDAGPSDTTALSGIIVVEKSDPREDTITLSEDADAGPSDTTALSEILVVEKSGPREDTITLKYSRISEFCQAYISSMLNQSNHQSSVQKSVVMKGTPVGMYCDGLLVLCTWFVESPNGAKLESSSLVEVGEFSEDRVKTFKNLWQDCGGAEVCFLCVPSDFSSGHVKTLKSEILSSGFAFCFLSEFVKSLACGFLEESAIFDCGLGDKFVVFIQANRQSIELSFVKYSASVGLHLVRSLIDRDVPVDCVIEVYVERLNSLLDKFAPMTYYALRNASVVVLGGSYSSCRAVIEALGSRFNVAVEEYDVKTVSKGAVFAGYSLIFEDPICKLNFLIQNAKFDSMSSIGGDEICLNCGVIKVNEDGEDGDREPEVDCCDKCVQPICTDCKLEGCSWCKFVGFSLMQTMRRYLHSGDLRRCEQVFKDYMNSGKQATVELYVTLAEGAMVGYSPWGMQLAFETLEEMTARGFKLNPEMGNDLLLAASGEKDGGYTMANYVWDLMRSGNITPSPPAVEAYYLGLKERDIPADDKRLILVSRTYDKQCQRFGQGPG